MYKLTRMGGSIGEANTYSNGEFFETKEEAQKVAKRWKASYSAAARKYYGVRYSIKEVKSGR